MEEALEQISDTEDRIMENNKAEQKRRIMDHENTRELSDSIKCSNICIIGVPERKTEKGAEGLFEEIIIENFPNLGKEINIQIQEAQRTPIKINRSRPTPDKISKTKEVPKLQMKTHKAKLKISTQKLGKPEGSSMIHSTH